MSLQIALERIQEAQKSNAFELDLSQLRLTNIPWQLFELTQLTELSLSRNQLRKIDGLEQLTKLTKLRLNNNQITEINAISQLRKLTNLNLNSNNISKIKCLEELTQLSILYIGENGLTEINGLEKLTQLTLLSLVNNQLTEINGLEKLKLLSVLFLSGNKLTEIQCLRTLTGLTMLNLDNNLLTKIPEYLVALNLKMYWEKNYITRSICLGHNPFVDPPAKIVMQGNEAIQEYFDQRKKSGAEVLNEAKLILLGNGRSGKTSLANRLLGKDLPKEKDRTTGVDIVIDEYCFPTIDGTDFKINIWDFAGQDKYKTLHQLFYTDSSLYVMVAESGNVTTDLDDWLQTAELFGEGSPLVLVLNEFKTGIASDSFDSNHWKKRFPELLKEVFTINLDTKENLPAAEEYIRLLAQTLPHTKYVFPSNWAAIRRVLNKRRDEQYITLQEYFKICAENDLPENESALILSSVLHKIGDCLHYQKSELLKQYIILNNKWATDAVYKILDDKAVAEGKCGFFNRADMERIWNSVEYKYMRPQLLELMQQFKLAYQLPGKEEYVTPPLLPHAAPTDFVWPDVDSLELYIEYEFLPKALLTQFIVTRHTDIAAGRTLVWRHGVILKWDGEALAVISKTKLEGKDAFHIRTQGSNRRGMMTVILKTFRDLHADYKGSKYKEKVPCICIGCKTEKNKQHYFDLAKLQFRLENCRYEVDCDESLASVNVLELLENTFVFERFKEGRPFQLKKDVVRDRPTEMRVLNMFFASSNELITERKEIEQALGRKNKLLRKQGFRVELLIWEDNQYIGTSLRSQDNYNLHIKQCNLFTMLFYSKVGKFSLEEFELALSLFNDDAMPRICVFQKDIDLPKKQAKIDADSRFAFIERLNELEHYTTLFENTDKLVNELEDVIDKLLQDKDFVNQLKTE